LKPKVVFKTEALARLNNPPPEPEPGVGGPGMSPNAALPPRASFRAKAEFVMPAAPAVMQTAPPSASPALNTPPRKMKPFLPVAELLSNNDPRTVKVPLE